MRGFKNMEKIIDKEQLKKLVSKGVDKSYKDIWSEYMSREDFENIKPLVEMSVVLVLMEFKKDIK